MLKIDFILFSFSFKNEKRYFRFLESENNASFCFLSNFLLAAEGPPVPGVNFRLVGRP